MERAFENIMNREKSFIVHSFRNNFTKYQNEKFAIYGLGKNTKVILDECTEFMVVALMDQVRTGESFWGYPVLDVEGVRELGVRKIVIVATSVNVPVIFNRIAKKCEEYHIAVYDINGIRQERKTKEYALPEFYQNMREEALREKIDHCDVVSFDVFDTLLVRSTLYPTDVFCHMEKKLGDVWGKEIPFARARIQAERELYLDGNPKLVDIYRHMSKRHGLSRTTEKWLMQLELEEEVLALHARQQMVGIVQYAIESGKVVCCTSDMYLSADFIERLLRENGYPAFDHIFVSCEHQTSKSSGLYYVLRQTYPEQRILHVGDNPDADIAMAIQYGIDDVFRIASPYQMLADSKAAFLMEDEYCLVERSRIGRIASELFNNPFILRETGGKCMICTPYQLGYYILAPIMEVFLAWIIEEAQKEKIEHLLLGARDGWLMQRLFDIHKKYDTLSFTYSYFYVSRSASTHAGPVSAEDVRYAVSLAYDGDIRSLIRTRFFIPEDRLPEVAEYKTREEYIEFMIPVILGYAEQYREDYNQYILSLRLPQGKLGFFDFVSSGTCQLWLENMACGAMTGFYFLRGLDVYMERLNIKSLFPPKFVYEKQSKLYENYIFMENIITSPEPALKHIGKGGKLIFEEETRTELQLEQLNEIHRGIADAYETDLKHGIPLRNEQFAGEVLSLVNGEFSAFSPNYMENDVLYDSFCNREFYLKNIREVSD